jgi:hypothetical protein
MFLAKSGVRERVFLVGAPRSGTTLLQSMLAAHPAVASFPESHFFRHLMRNRSRWRKRLGVGSRAARPSLRTLVEELGLGPGFVPVAAIMLRQYATAFVNALDAASTERGKAVWVEKTPGHLWHVADIERWIPGIKFIHIVRPGPDVIASLYEVTRDYPETWGRPKSIDECIRQWVSDVEITRRNVPRPSHFLVLYDQLLADPRAVVESLCDFLRLPFNHAMLTEYGAVSHGLVREWEPWKGLIGRPLQPPAQRKFAKIFDEEEQIYVLARLAEYEVTAWVESLGERPTTVDDCGPAEERRHACS